MRVVLLPLKDSQSRIVKRIPTDAVTLLCVPVWFCCSTWANPNTMSLIVSTLTADRTVMLEDLDGTAVLSDGMSHATSITTTSLSITHHRIFSDRLLRHGSTVACRLLWTIACAPPRCACIDVVVVAFVITNTARDSQMSTTSLLADTCVSRLPLPLTVPTALYPHPQASSPATDCPS